MSNLLTVKQFAEKHPAFSQHSLRYLIFHEKSNGLNSAIARIGRKILIREAAFFDWVDAQQTSKENGGH
jgi:hypothetical protein